MSASKRYDSLDGIDPRYRESFKSLAGACTKGPYGFRIFETYRSPERQLALLKQGVSRAKPGTSAHNYGLAADLVPYSRDVGGWHWPNSDWQGWVWLREQCRLYDLDNQTVGLEWDKPHVQVPNWRSLKDVAFKP